MQAEGLLDSTVCAQAVLLTPRAAEQAPLYNNRQRQSLSCAAAALRSCSAELARQPAAGRDLDAKGSGASSALQTTGDDNRCRAQLRHGALVVPSLLGNRPQAVISTPKAAEQAPLYKQQATTIAVVRSRATALS